MQSTAGHSLGLARLSAVHGSPAPLAVWQVSDSDLDIYARFVYYRIYLPLVVR